MSVISSQENSSIQSKLCTALGPIFKWVYCCFLSLLLISTVSDNGSSTKSSTNFASVSTSLVKISNRRTCKRSHVDFLLSCIKHDVIPKGMTVGCEKAALPASGYLRTMVDKITHCASNEILITCRDTYKSLINIEMMKMHKTLFGMQQRTTYHEYEAILKMQYWKSKASSKLHRKKQKQLLEQKKASMPTPAVKHKGRHFKGWIGSNTVTDDLTTKGEAE